MPFEYACFVSYRHGQTELTERIIGDLEKALKGELEQLLNQPLYIDRERLQGGSFYNEALSDALCQSVCMVVVYTPLYFDPEHPYCAREYKAMENLEQSRLAALNGASRQTNGLIIPIVFRGKDLLLVERSSQRHWEAKSGYQWCELTYDRTRSAFAAQ